MNDYTSVKLQPNIPVEVEFVWDDCKRWEHPEYGISYTANVVAHWEDRQGQHSEDKANLRMTPKLMSELIGKDVGKGSVVVICKITNDSNRTEYEYEIRKEAEDPGFFLKDRDRRMVDLQGDEIGRKVTGKGDLLGAKSSAADESPTDVTKPKATKDTYSEASPTWEAALEQQQSLYEVCLNRAQSIWTNFYGGEDKVADEILHATATTLAIALDRKGVRVPPTENATLLEFPIQEEKEKEEGKGEIKPDAPEWVTEDAPIPSEPQ